MLVVYLLFFSLQTRFFLPWQRARDCCNAEKWNGSSQVLPRRWGRMSDGLWFLLPPILNTFLATFSSFYSFFFNSFFFYLGLSRTLKAWRAHLENPVSVLTSIREWPRWPKIRMIRFRDRWHFERNKDVIESWSYEPRSFPWLELLQAVHVMINTGKKTTKCSSNTQQEAFTTSWINLVWYTRGSVEWISSVPSNIFRHAECKSPHETRNTSACWSGFVWYLSLS